jgi:alkanesulfonate monooxygenase SsuD/methylene tetrahydromethanopterin reductase-like flavin-dependent oxidoreductase (luciferase family)
VLEFAANFGDGQGELAGEWARQREDEGFDLVACGDHFWTVASFPHIWVTLAQQAAATSRIKLTSGFANNLFRSPVEFAQASLTLQQASGGRFEAGLGAGWSSAELLGASMEYPAPRQRARRFHEAMLIVRDLFEKGSCQFSGDHYAVDVPVLGPSVTPPPLIAAVGGPWVIQHVSPLADRVELNLSASAVRGGKLDLELLATVTSDDILRMVEQVRSVAPDIAISAATMVAVGDDPRVSRLSSKLGDAFLGGFFGPASRVAENVHRLETLGFNRVGITGLTSNSVANLAPALLKSATGGPRQ